MNLDQRADRITSRIDRIRRGHGTVTMHDMIARELRAERNAAIDDVFDVLHAVFRSCCRSSNFGGVDALRVASMRIAKLKAKAPKRRSAR